MLYVFGMLQYFVRFVKNRPQIFFISMKDNTTFDNLLFPYNKWHKNRLKMFYIA